MSAPLPSDQPSGKPSDQPSAKPPVRIGTAEREAAFAALNTHLDAGRLDVDEYGDRYAAVSLARTRPEVDAQFTDLPEPHPFPAPTPAQPSWVTSPPPAGPHGALPPNLARYAPLLLGLMPFIAIALAVTTHIWVFFLLVPATGVLLGRRGWRHGGRGYRGYRGYGNGWGESN